MIDTSAAWAPDDHDVHFFETDETLSLVVADYLRDAVANDEPAMVFATAAHRDLFRAALAATGVDVEAAEGDGLLCFRDAAETLSLFVIDGAIDTARFESVVGGLVRAAAAGDRSVKIYGEMVALLWDAGNVNGAIELERLWNELGESLPFGLLCAYPSRLFGDATGVEGFAQICHHHARVVNGAPIAPDVEVCRRFPGSAQTSRFARRYVGETLRSWGHDDVAELAMLVVSELAANAVLHAQSDVSVGIGRVNGRIRLVVGDTSDARPAPRTPDPLQFDGRGLRVVEHVADQWGHNVVAGGKLVWAELPLAGS